MTPMVATSIFPYFGRLACAYFHTSAHPIDNLARGFRHVLGIRAEKLHADRAFNFVEVEIFTRPFITAKNSFGRNKFSRENVGAVFFAELPEDLVRDAGHGCEIQRKAFGEPG